MSWILESNKGVRNIIEKFGSRITKRYRMYEKSLAQPSRYEQADDPPRYVE